MTQKRNIALLLILVFIALCAGCSDDDCPTCPDTGPTGPLADWIGEYDTATKWGGEFGVWQASSDLIVAEGGYIIYGTALILNPTIDGDNVSWTTTDGNAHNVNITFVTSQTSDYYWGDQGGGASGKLFTGTRQSGGDGPLDFRGLVGED
ncbi:MAG: hypothetical protein GY838_02225 [bacterium]|nr:hypothetical protein [bacterium]